MSNDLKPVSTLRPLPVSLKNQQIQVIYSQHKMGFREDWLSHQFMKLVIIDGGYGSLKVLEQEAVKVSCGDVIVIPRGLSHCWQDDSMDPLRLVVLCFPNKAMHIEVDNLIKSRLHHSFSRSSGETSRRLQVARLMVSEQLREELAWQASVLTQAQSLIIECLRREGSTQIDDPLIQEACACIEQQLSQALSIEGLAQRAGISYRSFTQRFKRSCGCTAQQFQRRVRIEEACRLLLSGMPIASVALELGYSDSSNFYTAFKQEQGCTPKQYLLKVGM